MNWALFNVIFLGLSFAFIFSGFQTSMMVQVSYNYFISLSFN